LKLLCFLPDLDGGGAQRTMVNLANAFVRDGQAAVLAVARGGGAAGGWLDDGVELVDLGAGRTRRAVRPLRSLVKRMRPDLLFSTMVDANIVAAAACARMPGAPRLVLRETNSHRARGDLGPIRRRLVRWAYRRADAVVALSSGVGAELVADYRLAPARVRTIHNPVATCAFAAAADRAREQAPPWGGWAGGAPVLVAAGRLTRQKGFDLLVDAVARLADRNARLVILGEGGERQALEERARASGLGDRLLLPGFVDDPADWYAHATLFVLSSRWEGFGHVIVEAMACGAPVVATDCPHGPRDIVTDGEDGRLVAPEDPVALAGAIGQLLADPSARHRLAAAGRQTADRFALDRIGAEYLVLMNRIFAEPASGAGGG
jgi:glycosyltransferase involved in cell wall biosynthesis